MPDLLRFAKTGPKGPSAASGDTSAPLVLANEVDCELGSPEPASFSQEPGGPHQSPDNGLYAPAINRWTSLELGWNNVALLSGTGFTQFS